MDRGPNFQEIAAKITREYGLAASVEARFIDLVSEVGELGKEILKGSDYGARDGINPTNSLSREMGDVIFSLCCIANSLHLNMEKCLAEAAEKYKARFARTKSIGS